MTVVYNITEPSPAATGLVIVSIATDKSKRFLDPGEPLKFNTYLDGLPLVRRHPVPMYETCRALLERGYGGQVRLIDHNTGEARMTMSIEAGAKLTVVEGPSGPVVRKYGTGKAAEPGKGGGKPLPATQVPNTELEVL